MKKFLSVLLLLSLSVCLCACGGPREVSDLTYTTKIAGSEYNGNFTGTILDKLPNGEGTFTYSDSTVTLSYTGTWEEGIPTGEGILDFDGYSVRFNDNSYTGIYSGAALNGIPHGNGSFNFSSEDGYLNYSGFWEDGYISGEGSLETDLYIIKFPDGTVRQGQYKGDTLDGNASGTGTFSAATDEDIKYTYTGDWADGIMNGYGKWIYNDTTTFIQEGNYKNGDFVPTPLQAFIAMGTLKAQPYEITENAISFLEKYPDIFLNNTIADTDVEFEDSFKYEAFAKNPAKFGNKLIKVSGLKVVQIFESTLWGYERTFCIAQDSHYNVYYINLLGYSDDVYEGDRITLTALPLDYFTYPNTFGESIWAISCAAISME